MRQLKKKSATPQQAIFFFSALLIALGFLFCCSNADPSLLRRFHFLRWVRLFQAQLVSGIFLLTLIVIIADLFRHFRARTKFSSTALLALLPFACLIASMFPFCSLIVWERLMYENWMWLCTAWTLSLGLFFSISLWALSYREQAFEAIAAGFKRIFAFAVQPKTHKADIVYLAVVFLFVFVIGVTLNHVLLGGIPHVHDSVSQFFQAKIFARGAFTAPTPETLVFFQRLYILTDQGRWYSIYPPGFTLLLAIGVAVGFSNLVNPLIVALAVLPLFFLAQRITSAPQARLAVALYAASPFTLIMAAGYMNHPTCLLFILIFFWGLLNSLSAKSKKHFYFWGAVAGFGLGYAYQTRPLTSFAFGILGGLWWLFHEKRNLMKRTAWTAVFLLGVLPPVLFQFTYNAKTTGSPWISPYQKQYNGIPLGFGDVAWISGEIMPNRKNTVHHTPLRGFSNSMRNLNGLNYWLFGWPAPCLVFAAALFLPGFKRNNLDWLVLAAALSQSVAYAFYFYQDFCFGPRFLYETSPFWFILTARGISELCGALPEWFQKSKQAVQGVVIALLAFWFIWALATAWPERLRDVGDEYWGVRDEVYAQVKNELQDENAVIFVEYDYDYYAVFTLLDPWLKSGWIVALDLGDERNRALIEQYPGWPVYRLYLSEDAPDDETITLIEPYHP
ncbi:MAG: glycosyltransferase family 39 protein [Candidatus Hinthialibacter antarcticus]|nr:glycosyltransferase family 39 protein [Candidatus Hinthialibacter antarcticus]